MSAPLVTGKRRLTATRARELLDYNPETGALTWKVYRGGRTKAGEEAGHVWRNRRMSYYRVKVDGIDHRAHRLCFLIYYGAWPSGEIDHIDGDGLNNRIANLRAVPGGANARNHPRQIKNTSGTTGVSWDTARSKWRAQIGVSGRRVHIGQFDTIAEAVSVRKRAERLHGYHENHGRGPEGLFTCLNDSKI
jgi:hypothetical protein